MHYLSRHRDIPGLEQLTRNSRTYRKRRGTTEDLARLPDIADNVSRKCLCPLGDASPPFILSTMQHFRPKFVQHIEDHTCAIAPALLTSA